MEPSYEDFYNFCSEEAEQFEIKKTYIYIGGLTGVSDFETDLTLLIEKEEKSRLKDMTRKEQCRHFDIIQIIIETGKNRMNWMRSRCEKRLKTKNGLMRKGKKFISQLFAMQSEWLSQLGRILK